MSRENIRWSTFLARSILKPQNSMRSFRQGVQHRRREGPIGVRQRADRETGDRVGRAWGTRPGQIGWGRDVIAGATPSSDAVRPPSANSKGPPGVGPGLPFCIRPICGEFLHRFWIEAILRQRAGQWEAQSMVAFVRRLAIHYSIYRRYPLPRLPALKSAWRIARA